MATGNLFQSTENVFAGADTQKITGIARDSLSEFLQAAHLTDPQTAFKAMIMIARIGLEAKQQLTQKQKDFVKSNFSTFYTGPMETIYPMLVGPIAPEEYKLLENFCKLGMDRIGIPLLIYALSFAYCDGAPSAELEKKLEEIFGAALLVGFLRTEPNADAEEAKNAPTPADIYREELRKWEETRNAIWEQRNKETQMLRQQARDDLIAQWEKYRDETIQTETERKEGYTKRYRAAHEELSRLGILQFVRKRQLENEKQAANAGIEDCDRNIQSAKTRYRWRMEELEDDLRPRYSEIYAQMEEKYPVPPKPKDPNAKPSAAEIVANNYKKEIMETIRRYGTLSATEIMNKCTALAGLTIQRVRPYLMSLVSEGRLTESTKQQGNMIHHYYTYLK